MTDDIQNKIAQIRKKTTPIFKKYPVQKAGVFGSVLRGEDKADSDIDLLVELNNIGFQQYLEMKRSIEKELNKEVDLVQYKLIKPALREYILPYEVNIYEKDS